MAIETVTFNIVGMSPILMHNPAAMQRSSGGMKRAETKIPTPKEEADAGCYRTEKGFLYIPSMAFRSSLMSGAVGKKIGKQTAWKMVACGVFNTQLQCPVLSAKTGKPLKDYTRINTSRVVLGSGKNAKGILRSRPEIEDWASRVEMEIDTDFITVDHVLELFNLAGRMIGILDWRIEKKGLHGRYSVGIAK